MKKLLPVVLIILFGCSDSDTLSLSNSGQGGSMARFAVSNNHLYVVTSKKLVPFDISDNWNPQQQSDIFLGNNIETIYPYQHYLFVGSETGMQIYDVSSQQNPKYVSSYQHVRSCDPVVAQGNYAYVTLRTTSICEGTINALEIVDISNIANPKLLTSYSMRSPYGLGIDGSDLFVCEGDHGFVAMDASNPGAVTVKKEFANHNAYDLILNDGLMIVTGEDGIYQYNYDSTDTLTLLSKIRVVRDAI